MKLRKARATDVKAIQQLVNRFADGGDMLHRSLNEIYENVRDYHVVEDRGRLMGCCALHVNWENLAEVKALAVAEAAQGKGWGKKLLDACLADAQALGIEEVFALTYRRDYFEKHGFAVVDKNTLPHKVWTECIHCPKFPDCDEVAMVYEGWAKKATKTRRKSHAHR